jgi:hypothetical protein
MHDTRAPEVRVQIEGLPLADRLAMMHAMAFAFPSLKNDRDRRARIEAVVSELKPSAKEYADIVLRADHISIRLKAALLG